MRSACEPCLFDKLSLEGVTLMVRAVEVLGGRTVNKIRFVAVPGVNSALEHIKALSIRSVPKKTRRSGDHDSTLTAAPRALALAG